MDEEYKYVEAKGTNYEIGLAIGESLKEDINEYKQRIDSLYSKQFKTIGDKDLIEKTKKLIKKYFPNYIQELKGLADGAGLGLNDIILLSNEETFIHNLKDRCTTFAYSCEDGIFLCHNEDWLPGYEDFFYIIKAKPKKGPSFLSLAYTGSLPGSSAALNSYGIAFSGNSLLTGVQHGMPKNVILRSQIEAKNLREFERLASFSPRAIPNHSMAIDKHGRIISVEAALNIHKVIYKSNFFGHTNHPLHPEIAKLEYENIQNSKKRYNTVIKHLTNSKLEGNLAKKVLRSHENAPHAVCSHTKGKKHSDSKTIASIIINVKDKSMLVAKGNPCKTRYKRYNL